jgi:hypothetical protein
MPQRTGPATFQEFARALRRLAPEGTYEGVGDAELVHAAVGLDPTLKSALIADPLEGIELLSALPPVRTRLPGGPPQLPPTRSMPPTPFSTVNQETGEVVLQPPPTPEPPLVRNVAMGLRAGPEMIGSIVGGVLGGTGGLGTAPVTGPGALPAAAAGTIAGESFGGAVGAGIGEIMAQEFELKFGSRLRRSPAVVGGATALGGVPIGLADESLGVAVNLGRRMGQGAAFSTADLAMRTQIEEGRPPTAEEFLATGVAGAAVGIGLGGLEQGVRSIARSRGRRRGGPARAEAEKNAADIQAVIKQNAADDAAELAQQQAALENAKRQVFETLVNEGVDPTEAVRLIEMGETPPIPPRGLLSESTSRGREQPVAPVDEFAQLRQALAEQGASPEEINRILGPAPQAAAPRQAFGATQVTPEGVAIPPQVDVTGAGPPPFLSRAGDPGPPPTTTDLMESQLRASLEAPNVGGISPRLNTTRGIRLTADPNLPPIFTPTTGPLKGIRQTRKPRVKKRPVKRERLTPSITEATGGAVTRSAQQRLRDVDMDTLPEGAMDDPGFVKAAQLAVLEGFDGSEALLYRRWLENVEAAAERNAGAVDAETLLLRTVARLGGIGPEGGFGNTDEFARLLQMRDRVPRRGRGGVDVKPTRGGMMTTSSVVGIRNVVRSRGVEGGKSLDTMAEALRGEGIRIDSPNELLDAIDDAITRLRQHEAGTLQGANVKPDDGPGWWQRAADQDFAEAFAETMEDNVRRVSVARDLDNAREAYLRILTGAEGEDLEARVQLTRPEGIEAGLPPAGTRRRTIFQQMKDRCG